MGLFLFIIFANKYESNMKVTSYERRSEILGKYPHLEGIEITTDRSGYPRGLHAGVIGFSSIEEAEKIASEYSGVVVEFNRRDGWQLWYCDGQKVYKDTGLERFNDDRCKIFTDVDDVETEFKDDISSIDYYDYSIESVENLLNIYKNLRDEVENMGEGKVLVRYHKDYYEIVDEHVMQYHDDDVFSFAIGVELFAIDIDEDE